MGQNRLWAPRARAVSKARSARSPCMFARTLTRRNGMGRSSERQKVSPSHHKWQFLGGTDAGPPEREYHSKVDYVDTLSRRPLRTRAGAGERQNSRQAFATARLRAGHPQRQTGATIAHRTMLPLAPMAKLKGQDLWPCHYTPANKNVPLPARRVPAAIHCS